MFPEASVAVTVTEIGLDAKSAQAKALWLYVIVGEDVQLSVALPAVNVAAPLASNVNVTSDTLSTGASLS